MTLRGVSERPVPLQMPKAFILVLLIDVLATLKIRKKPVFTIMRFADTANRDLAETTRNVHNIGWLTKAGYATAETVYKIKTLTNGQPEP